LAWSGRGGALVALLALGASVSAAGEERCSLAGGETWREYQSAHFVIVDAKQMKDRLTEMQKRCAAAQDPLPESVQ